MDGLFSKVGIFLAILSYITTAGITYFFTDSECSNNVEKITVEKEKWKTKHNNLDTRYIEQISSLKISLSELTKKHESLKEQHSICISSKGGVRKVPNDDFWKFNTIKVSKGDAIEFGITSVPLEVHLVRVSKDGPVIKIKGCNRYLSDNGKRSSNDGKHAYYLNSGFPLKLTFSNISCKKGVAFLADSDREILQLKVTSYNVEKQTANINYYRTLEKK